MRKLLFTAMLISALLVGFTSTALAAHPVVQGCAPAWDVWDVATPPYMVPAQLDLAGNADGFVCAKTYGPAGKNMFTDENGQSHQIYWFRDNVIRNR